MVRPLSVNPVPWGCTISPTIEARSAPGARTVRAAGQDFPRGTGVRNSPSSNSWALLSGSKTSLHVIVCASTCPSTCWPGRTQWRGAGQRWRPLQTAPRQSGWWCHGTAGWTGTGSWCGMLPSCPSLCWSGRRRSHDSQHWYRLSINVHPADCGLYVQRQLYWKIFVTYVLKEHFN